MPIELKKVPQDWKKQHYYTSDKQQNIAQKSADTSFWQKGDKLYRAMNNQELGKLIQGETVYPKNESALGISFTKYKAVTLHPNFGPFTVTFDRNIMEQNFQLIDIVNTKEWLSNNLLIAFNQLGISKDDGVKFNDFKLYFISALGQQYAANHNNYECFIKLFNEDNPGLMNMLLSYGTMKETLLIGNYWFVPYMILNIDATEEKYLEWLGNFCYIFKDKLNLDFEL
jgi:hypothetical protein